MNEQISKLLTEIKSRIHIHNEFKKTYNKQLAFDFNFFNFFAVGENKISEIIAFFLRSNSSHGQGIAFLKEFIDFFKLGITDFSKVEVECEKTLPNDRRLDIYIKFSGKCVAIENKIWAIDQSNQLRDYANFLEKESNGNYLIFYLTPYGNNPSVESIEAKLFNELINKDKIRIISYRADILPLLDKWSSVCEADNVAYFIKQIKLHLKNIILGEKSISMEKSLESIIFENRLEVDAIVKAYKKIEDKAYYTINSIGKELHLAKYKLSSELYSLKKVNPFNHEGKRVYKFGIESNSNTIWVQLYADSIDIISASYIEKGSDSRLRTIMFEGENRMNENKKLDNNLSKSEIIDIFLTQVSMAEKVFEDYDKVSKI